MHGVTIKIKCVSKLRNLKLRKSCSVCSHLAQTVNASPAPCSHFNCQYQLHCKYVLDFAAKQTKNLSACFPIINHEGLFGLVYSACFITTSVHVSCCYYPGQFSYLFFFLTFCGPCIMIYFHNNDQKGACFFLNSYQ